MSDNGVTLRTANGVRANLIRMAATVNNGAVGVYTVDDPLRAVLRADDDEDSPLGTIVGYPIVFDTWTEINSWWEGHFLERIDPAATDVTLARRGHRVRVLLNHGMDPQIGDKPLGKPRVQTPDERGMWAETPMSDTSYNRDIAALIRDGALDGQSFRFSVMGEEWVSYGEDDDRPDYNPEGLDERTITRLDLHEHGPVTFPAYEATTLGLRSRAEVQAWQSGEPAARETLVALIAERAALRDIDVADVLQRANNGSRVVEDGPPAEDLQAATSDADAPSDTSRADDPQPPGRDDNSRRELAERLRERVASARQEAPRELRTVRHRPRH